MITNTYIKKMNELNSSTKSNLGFKASSPAKISVTKGCAFSLPASAQYSCPGETPACAGCYAMKGRHIFINTQSLFLRNWRNMKACEDQGRAGIKTCADNLAEILPKKGGIFRIHESGDFHSQFSITVWLQVIKSRPDITFWAYTRSFDFNYKSITKLPNFSLLVSTDDYNMVEAKKFAKKYKLKLAYGPWGKDTTLPKGSFVCPATNGKMEMAGACEKCKLCFSGKTVKDVVFIKH